MDSFDFEVDKALNDNDFAINETGHRMHSDMEARIDWLAGTAVLGATCKRRKVCRKNDILKAFNRIPVYYGVKPHDFIAFKAAYIARYRELALPEFPAKPYEVWTEQLTCHCTQCNEDRSAA
jgi:hypothetical protein